MILPKSIAATIQQEYIDGSYPLVEIELNGTIFFKQLIETIQHHYEAPYTIVKAEIEYQGKANFGTLLVHLKGSKEKNEQVIHYFNQLNVKNFVRGYLA